MKLVEDASHSRVDGAERKQAETRSGLKRLSSFHPVKHICAGEGGAV